MKNGVVAGAGVLLDTREVSFTCDGKLQGIAFRQVPKEPDLYPAISFFSCKERCGGEFWAEPVSVRLDDPAEEGDRWRWLKRRADVGTTAVGRSVR